MITWCIFIFFLTNGVVCYNVVKEYGKFKSLESVVIKNDYVFDNSQSAFQQHEI